MSKSASSWNFVPDRLILSFVRPTIATNRCFKAKRTIVIYGPSYKAAFDRYDRYGLCSICSIDSIDSIFKKRKNFETPLLKELSRSSQDSFESESDSKESRDDRLNSFKSGIFHFCHFLANRADRPGILSNRIPIRKNPRTIGLIRPKVAKMKNTEKRRN